jgi:[acyl-carrier-protein] S-malonyltransferase
VQEIEALGCKRAIEIGPGKILKGLIKRIRPSVEIQNLEGPRDLKKILAQPHAQ